MRRLLLIACMSLALPRAFALSSGGGALACSPAAVAAGSSTTCTFTFTGSTVAPTGTVTFYAYLTSPAGAIDNTTITGTASGTQFTASASLSLPSAGSWIIQSTYSGDSNYGSSAIATYVTVTGSTLSGPQMRIETGHYRKVFATTGWTYFDSPGDNPTINPAGAYTPGSQSDVSNTSTLNGGCTWTGPPTTISSSKTLSITVLFQPGGVPGTFQSLGYTINGGSEVFWYSGTAGPTSYTTYTAAVPAGTTLTSVNIYAQSDASSHLGSMIVKNLSIQ